MEPGSPREPANRDRLFRNDLQDSGTVLFQDVTDATGIEVRDYGMGVAAGDYDNDGDTDVIEVNNNGQGQPCRDPQSIVP